MGTICLIRIHKTARKGLSLQESGHLAVQNTVCSMLVYYSNLCYHNLCYYKGIDMKFYARDTELQILEKQYEQTRESSSMTVITGRRRIGKTLLSITYAKDKRYVYLFIPKKNEPLVCRDCIETIRNTCNIPVLGEVKDFVQVVRLLMEIGLKERLVVIIDEFQEFFHINPAVYSEIQHVWDHYKYRSKVHMIFIGSIYSLMSKIFTDSREPLFGRADRIIYLKSFTPQVIGAILKDYGHYSIDNLFFIFLVTGGVPRYLEILSRNNVFTKGDILDFILQEGSPFLDEGKLILIEEFGKEYGTYFSILELMSEGRTSRSEIESILEKNIGGYLEKLEHEYDLIARRRPVGAKSTGKVQKYHIKDNFLQFWFKFIYANHSALEIGNVAYVHHIIDKQLLSYSGPILERLFQELFKTTGEYTRIGNYWERGNTNEIDIVAVNEERRHLFMAEVKMNKQKAVLNQLEKKSSKLIKKFPGYSLEYACLGLEDVEVFL